MKSRVRPKNMLLIDEGLLMYMLSDLIKASLLPPLSIKDVIMASL
jgi:hypothetical protein